ncbi:heterokaryon incompatibility protein-domain-containing protein, partial [Bisporella sp. PMI_857]
MSPRAMEPLLPVGLLKHWIHICQDTHGSACGSPPWAAGVGWPQSLRLIDVKRSCIVTPPDKIRYVALSYVWGTLPSGIFKRNWLSMKPAHMRTCDSTIQSLQKEDSLLQAKLPTTIREAMSLIDNLGETYLWVDCLCVIQDNAADLAIQIPQMDVIYANAAFTIVAGSGSSSDATLSRYHGPVNPRPVKGCRVTENLSLISSFHRSSHRTVFQDSTWMQRGWTFQEYLLSRRKIFLLKDRVYWQCESD